MSRGWGTMLALCTLAACGETDRNKHESDSTDTTDTSATNTESTSTSQGPSSTSTTSTMSTTSQGPSSTTSSTTSQGQGGASGQSSSTSSGGSAGACEADADCVDDCPAACVDYCSVFLTGFVVAECGSSCVCEIANDPYKPVYEAMAACELEEPCPPSVQHWGAGPFTWHDGACLLTALRDRTPGAYHHSRTLADESSTTFDYTFLLGGNDEVLVLTKTGVDNFDNIRREYEPVWSCTLKSRDELEACVAAGTEERNGVSICRETQDWLEACQSIENPTCPGE